MGLAVHSVVMSDGGSEIRGRRIPEATVVRLPVYQRILADLLAHEHSNVSSEQLAVLAGVNAAKVRKDLSYLGSLGTRGTGYDVALLVSQIDLALGADRDWPIAIVGIGNLGRALANSEGFSARGFRVAALFDADPAVVGTTIGSVIVRHIDELAPVAAQARPAVGVVATPALVAQDVTDALVSVGVPSILNFAPCVLTVPPAVVLRYVDLSVELQVMSFYQARSGSGVDATPPSIGSGGRRVPGPRPASGRLSPR